MKNFTLRLFTLTLLSIFSNMLMAQDYEIRAMHKGAGLISVEARFVGVGAEPSAGADAFLDFTIDLRWPAAANLNMENPNNTGGYSISKAGSETIDGADEYQGYQLSVAPAFLPETWTRDNWIEIFTVQSNSDGGTGENIVVGESGSNPVNPNIPNFNMSGTDFVPMVNGFAVLPVELTHFSAKKNSTTASELTWSTASEQNTSHFNIERSTDAKRWEVIGKANATGNSFQSIGYHFLDKNIPLKIRQSKTVYYRLNIIDFDGYQEYSAIESVEFEIKENKLSIYPNPTEGFLNIVSDEAINTVIVFNNLGKILVETKNNFLDLTAFPAGIYRIKVETESDVMIKTIVKAD